MPNIFSRLVDQTINYGLPNFFIGFIFLTVWPLILLSRTAQFSIGLSFFLLIFVFIFSLGGHLIVVHSGNYMLSWIATGYILMSAWTIVQLIKLLSVILERPIMSQGSLHFIGIAGGISALGYNESVRITFARRRHAQVDSNVYLFSALTVLACWVLTTIGIGIAREVLPNSTEEQLGFNKSGDNLWVVIFITVTIFAVGVLLLLPSLGKERLSVRRFKHGKRIPPPVWPTNSSQKNF